jgi:hypothetical protein
MLQQNWRRRSVDFAAAGVVNNAYTEVITMEAIVNHPKSVSEPKQGKHTPGRVAEADKQRQKAEANEVAGRHKNDGQMPHKGAR